MHGPQEPVLSVAGRLSPSWSAPAL